MNTTRQDCTLRHPCEPRNRRERLHCLVHHSDLAAQQLADRIGCRYDRLIAYSAVNGTDEMPLRTLVALTRETGRSFALAAEAAECGFLLVKHPSALSVSDPLTELIDVFVGTGTLAERHRSHAEQREPATLQGVIAAARTLQTDIAEFIQAAEASQDRPMRVVNR